MKKLTDRVRYYALLAAFSNQVKEAVMKDLKALGLSRELQDGLIIEAKPYNGQLMLNLTMNYKPVPEAFTLLIANFCQQSGRHGTFMANTSLPGKITLKAFSKKDLVKGMNASFYDTSIALRSKITKSSVKE